MLQSEDSMRPPAALKSLGMVLARALNRPHAQNAQGVTLVFCILTKFRMAAVLTHPIIRSPTTKVTSPQPSPILLVTRERIQVKLLALLQTSLNQYPYRQPVCLPPKHKFC